MRHNSAVALVLYRHKHQKQRESVSQALFPFLLSIFYAFDHEQPGQSMFCVLQLANPTILFLSLPRACDTN